MLSSVQTTQPLRFLSARTFGVLFQCVFSLSVGSSSLCPVLSLPVLLSLCCYSVCVSAVSALCCWFVSHHLVLAAASHSFEGEGDIEAVMSVTLVFAASLIQVSGCGIA